MKEALVVIVFVFIAALGILPVIKVNKFLSERRKSRSVDSIQKSYVLLNVQMNEEDAIEAIELSRSQSSPLYLAVSDPCSSDYTLVGEMKFFEGELSK